MSNPNRVPEGVPTGGQFAASAKAESGVTLAGYGRKHVPALAWEVNPEDPDVQWTVGPEETYCSVYAKTETDVWNADDYPFPTTRTTWVWSVESAASGDTLAEGTETREDAAKCAAEAVLAAKPAGFATERKDGILTVTCLGCDETSSQPDKGLGRANLGAWKTRHQH